MKRLTALAALTAFAFISGCEKQEPPEPVGKYVIYQNANTYGTFRLNTVTGDVSMLIPSDTELMHKGVTMDGKPLVWRHVADSTAN